MARVRKDKNCKHPYLGYLYYKSKLSGRICYYLYNPKTGKRKLLTRARYRLSVELGRRLKRKEHVDHIDGDKTNDKINNLQILSLAQNNRKSVIENGKVQKWVKLKCPVCRNKFKRKKHRVGFKIKSGKVPTCSRSCGGKLGHSKRGKLVDGSNPSRPTN